MDNDLSERGRVTNSHKDLLGKYWVICQNEGVVNLGTAENNLADSILLEKLNSKNFNLFEQWTLHYNSEYHGSIKLREIAGKFFDRYFLPSAPIDPHQLSMVLGTASIIDILAHAICNPGDVFLIPSPHYTRIWNDCHERALVETCEVPMDVPMEGEKLWEPSVRRFQMAYDKAISQGKRVRGVFLLNPQNPLGQVYSQETILSICDFAKSRGLWVLVDEMYALSVFDPATNFQSLLSYLHRLPDPERTVWMWGLGKDLCTAGFRVAFVHSPHEGLNRCIRKLTMFQCVPTPLHSTVCQMLSDFDWLDSVFFPEKRQLVLANYRLATEKLANIGVPFLPAKAGFFIWLDFRKLLEKSDFDEEMALFQQLVKGGVYFAPGQTFFSSEPGWFRLIFTVAPDVLQKGLERIETVLRSLKTPSDQ